MFWRKSGASRTSLSDLLNGLQIRDALLPWGTTPADAAQFIRIPRDNDPNGWQAFETACAAAYGFDTAGVNLSGPRRDRPITGAAYELAQPRRDPLPDPAIWIEPLSRTLGGAPSKAEWHDVPTGADASGCVRYYAQWKAPSHSVGLSAYGGPRRGAHGTSAGCLWLSWSTVAAAAPFLPDWRARAATLVQRAAAPAALQRFRFEAPQLASSAETGTQAREAHYALNAPDILPTPISLGVDSCSIALWQADGVWYASTAWDSVELSPGQRARRIELLPAKGGGSSELRIGGWGVRDYTGSSGIAAAAEAIAALPGIRIEQFEGYDC